MSEKNQLRRRLNEALRSRADFDAFCQDFFPDVRQRYSTSTDRVVILNLLLELYDCEQILNALEQYSGSISQSLHKSLHVRGALIVAGFGSVLLLVSLFVHESRPRRPLQGEQYAQQPPPKPTNPNLSSLLPAVISLPIESEPAGAMVRNADNALLCVKTPCTLRVPAHTPLELRFTYPGRESIFKTSDPTLDLQNGGVRVYILPGKVP